MLFLMGSVPETSPSKTMPPNIWACQQCGSFSRYPARQIEGHLAVEIALWLFFLVPGLIYSIWRNASANEVCCVCGGRALIPAQSPQGIKLAEDWDGMIYRPAESSLSRIGKVVMLLGLVCGIGFLLYRYAF
jgi:hypothetical protein